MHHTETQHVGFEDRLVLIADNLQKKRFDDADNNALDSLNLLCDVKLPEVAELSETQRALYEARLHLMRGVSRVYAGYTAEGNKCFKVTLDVLGPIILRHVTTPYDVDKLIAYAYYNMGVAYAQLADVAAFARDAELYFQRAKPLFEELQHWYGLGCTLAALGQLRFMNKEYEAARDYFDDAEKALWISADPEAQKLRGHVLLSWAVVLSWLNNGQGSAAKLKEAVEAMVDNRLGRRLFYVALRCLGSRSYTLIRNPLATGLLYW